MIRHKQPAQLKSQQAGAAGKNQDGINDILNGTYHLENKRVATLTLG